MVHKRIKKRGDILFSFFVTYCILKGSRNVTVRAAGQEVSSTDSNIARVRKGVLP